MHTENAILRQRVADLERDVARLEAALALAEARAAKGLAAPVGVDRTSQTISSADRTGRRQTGLSSSESSFIDIVTSAGDAATDTDRDDEKVYVQCASPRETFSSSSSDHAVMIDDPDDPKPRIVAKKKTADPNHAPSSASVSAGPSVAVKSPAKSTEVAAVDGPHAVSTAKRPDAGPATTKGRGMLDLEEEEDEEGGWDSAW